MMSKIFIVAINEYRQNVFKKSFILILLSVPLFIAFSVGFGAFMASFEEDDAPIGYVDHSGVLDNPLQAPISDPDEAIRFIPFLSEEEARVALEAEEIQAFYVLSESYLQNRAAELVYFKTPGSNATSQFYDFLQVNLLSGETPEVAIRGASGNKLTLRAPDGSREFPDGGPSFGVVLPLIIGLALMFLLMTAGGFMMEGVVQERENRTIEVIVTSISPGQMVAGKILGIVWICLTILLFWILFGTLAIFLAQNVFDIEWFANPAIDWRGILSITLVGIPTFMIATALMFTVGALVSESQEGQAVGPILFILAMIPIWFIIKIGEAPNGPFAIGLSMVPFASLMTIGVRNMLIEIPWWQVLVSAGIQTLVALVVIWLGGRAFRFGMLRAGQRVRMSEVLRRNTLGKEKASQEGLS